MNDKTQIESILENYAPSQETIAIVSSTPIALLAGISGAGKGTIREKLLETGDYINFVSHTTRQPRENNGVMERDGVEYHFISIDRAIDMLKNGEFIEAKYYSNNVYGTTTMELMRAKESGKIALNDIEIQGIDEYLGIAPSTKVIFIVPPNHTVWLERLIARYEGVVDLATLQPRLETARKELASTLSDTRFSFVVNDDLGVAVRDTENAIKHGTHDDSGARTVAQEILDYLSSDDRDGITNGIIADVAGRTHQ